MPIDPKWEAFARLQNDCAKRTKVDAVSFALESGLDRMLDCIGIDATDRETSEETAACIDRTRRREGNRFHLRDAAVLRAADNLTLSLSSNYEASLQARDSFRRLMAMLNSTDQIIVQSVAIGHSSEECGQLVDLSAAAVRARISRIRRNAGVIVDAFTA